MDLLPGSYARLAGVQSEVNKRTITRVASNEVEYRRCLDSYRKDMYVNINHIKREEVNLRRSLMRYSRALKKHRREKSRRIRYERSSGFPAKGEQPEKSQSFALPDIGTSADVVRRRGSCTNSSPDSILPQLQVGLKLIPEHQVDPTGTVPYSQTVESVADPDKPKFAKRKLSISTLQNQASSLDCQISEMSRSDSKTRIPDTRDNPHFRGIHGEVYSPVSSNMIRTAAVIYTIKHGYDGKPAKTAPIAPSTDARSHKKSRRHWESIRKSLTASKKVQKTHLELSTKSMLCFPHLVQEITRLKAAGKLQNGFQNAHVESMTSVKRRECHDAAAASRKEVAKLHALDAGPSALHGVWNGQVTWHTSSSHQMKYRSDLPFERGTNGHKKLSAKMAGDTGNTKVGWQSALQKLKMVHTLS